MKIFFGSLFAAFLIGFGFSFTLEAQESPPCCNTSDGGPGEIIRLEEEPKSSKSADDASEAERQAEEIRKKREAERKNRQPYTSPKTNVVEAAPPAQRPEDDQEPPGQRAKQERDFAFYFGGELSLQTLNNTPHTAHLINFFLGIQIPLGERLTLDPEFVAGIWNDGGEGTQYPWQIGGGIFLHYSLRYFGVRTGTRVLMLRSPFREDETKSYRLVTADLEFSLKFDPAELVFGITAPLESEIDATSALGAKIGLQFSFSL